MTHKKQISVDGSLERGCFPSKSVGKTNGRGLVGSGVRGAPTSLKPGLNPSTASPHAYNSRAWEGGGRADLQGHPWV